MNRMRRLRANETIRSLVREHVIHKSELVYPVFIIEGERIKNPIDSMPGIYQYSIDMFQEELDRIQEAGIHSILIFGIPLHKDEVGSEAYHDEGITQRAIRFIKQRAPKLLIIADVCLCEYTSHGHCGLVCGDKIMNDETLPLLAKMAVSMAKAGADIIAPSDMMDGRIGFIRDELDKNGYKDTILMAYSAKYASGYYSPFRDAADSAPEFGNRKTYQMDPANLQEAVRECRTDMEEGADIIMVKPALAYLDVIREVSSQTDYPLAAYNVSGEYSMVKAAALNGWIDEKKIVMENLLGMKRAGAKIIITYHALDAARWLDEEYEQGKSGNTDGK